MGQGVKPLSGVSQSLQGPETSQSIKPETPFPAMAFRLEGVVVPMVTPYASDFSLDLEATRWLSSNLSSRGVAGIFVNSSVGEFVHLSRDEVIKLTRQVIEAKGGGVKVMGGVSANYTEDAVSLGKALVDVGVDAIVATTPFYFKVGPEALIRHFSIIADKVDVPLIIYNIPIFTGIEIPLSVYVKLLEHQNVVGTKVTVDSLDYMRRLVLRLKPIRRDFSIMTGFDDYLLPLLLMGGDGGVMGLANAVPQVHLSVYRSWKEGKLREASEEWRKLLSLERIYDHCGSYTASIKGALEVLGTPVKRYVREPLVPCGEEEERSIGEILRSSGVLGERG
jgi:4-hydroxy-tetrahydrodipicolinate synthase